MAHEATEIAYLPLLPGTNLEEGDAKQIWDSTLRTVSSQPGYRRIYWGRIVETPDIVHLVVIWDQVSSHHAFIESPVYQPFLKELGKILASSPTVFHLRLPVDLPFLKPGTAPTTECISLYFDPSYPSSTYDANWSSFRATGLKLGAEEIKGLSAGWGIEEHTHEKLGTDGQEGKAKFFGAFIGWDSVEAHMEFRKKEGFPDVIKYLRDGPSAIKVHHVHFIQY